MNLARLINPDHIAQRLADRDQCRATGAVVNMGTHRENPGRAPTGLDALMKAAVLVPLIQNPSGLSVLLTQRTDHLDHHPGQISFPGGRLEDHDATPTDAALRETEEEVGVPRSSVSIIGRLDDYITGTGFTVVPVVGLITPPYPLQVDSFEVADVFEVPLSFLMDPSNHARHLREKNGQSWRFYAMPYGPRFIWGATAGMVRNFYEILAGEDAVPPPVPVHPTAAEAAQSPL